MIQRTVWISQLPIKADLRFFDIDVYLRQLRVSAVGIFMEIGTEHVRVSTILDAIPKCELTVRDVSIRFG
jgi:hypothetical protein